MNLDHLYGIKRLQKYHITFDLYGADNLIDDLNVLPYKTTRSFSWKWAMKVLKRIKLRAPKDTGDLRRGIDISVNPERSSRPGKAVWYIFFDDSMTDTFVKYSKNGKRYYYPASQNYGFDIPKRTTLPGSPNRRNHVPGIYFMQNGLADVAPAYVAAAQSLIERVTKNG